MALTYGKRVSVREFPKDKPVVTFDKRVGHGGDLPRDVGRTMDLRDPALFGKRLQRRMRLCSKTSASNG